MTTLLFVLTRAAVAHRVLGHSRFVRGRPILISRPVTASFHARARPVHPVTLTRGTHVPANPSAAHVPHRGFPTLKVRPRYGGRRVPSRRSPAHGGAGCPEPTEGRSPGRVPPAAVACLSAGKPRHRPTPQAAGPNTRRASNACPSRSMAYTIISTLRPVATSAFL
jgi:hypothetical protein